MKIKRIPAALLAAIMTASMIGCGEEDNSPKPVEASDPNAVTFDDDDCSFASIICDDNEAADGTLSVEKVKGNKMLKFTDSFIHDYDKQVQKISINAFELLGAENLEKVSKIEFDMYADALEDCLQTEDGNQVKAPGWVGGGGGSVTALKAKPEDEEGKWYQFSEFSGEEYKYDFCGPIHGDFKFLLASSGQKWSAEMDKANFLIMRWGSQNKSNIYIDNIVFFDADGNSIPTVKASK